MANTITITAPAAGSQHFAQNELRVAWRVDGSEPYYGAHINYWNGRNWEILGWTRDPDTYELTVSASRMKEVFGGSEQYRGVALQAALLTESGGAIAHSKSITIYIRDAQPPQSPRLISPASGTQYYVNQSIPVEWQYSGELPQGWASISISVNNSGKPWQLIHEFYGDATSYSIPADTLRPWLTQGARSTAIWIALKVADSDNQIPQYSSNMIYVLSTVPDKPIPTAPINNAQTYPAAETIFTAPYEDHGGLELIQTVIEWYKDGEAQWSHYKTFDDSAESHSLPAGTFGLGTWHWRMRHRNAINEDGPWSDPRTLYSISSAPLRPTLTQPENGSTIYNNAPVEFGWSYSSSGVAQGGYNLKYNVGGSGWISLSGTGEDTTRAVDLSGQSGVVQWQVQVKNILGEYSSWSAIGAFNLSSSAPVGTPTYPTGGFIDRHESQTFTWDYQSPINSPQNGYQIVWSVVGSGTDWNRIVGSGSAPQHTLPADFFPEAQAIVWRLLVEDSAGIQSAFTDDFTFSTQDVAPDAPTLLEPIGLYLPPDQDIQFRWRHNSSLGTPQGKAEIQWRLNAGEWNTISADGSAQQATVGPGTFSAGTISWQARTANRDGDWGPWAQISTFGITGAPATPVITQVFGTARPGIDWLAPGQIVYQIEFSDQNNNLIYQDTRLAEGDSGSYRIPRYLMPGLIRIRLRVKNQYDSWSPWASTQIQVAEDGMPSPGIGAYGDNQAGVIRISVDGVDWATATRVILYRDGAPIASLTGGNYTDATCAAGVHTYSILAEYAGTKIARSAEIQAELKLYAIALAALDKTESILWISHDLDNPPGREVAITPESGREQVSGRALPMAFFGEHIMRAYSISCAMNAAQVAWLTDIMHGRIIYRDPDGRADICQITSVQGRAIPYAPMRRQVSIAMDAVDAEAFEIF